jgi:aflatoxin B1 aldehyde reductase
LQPSSLNFVSLLLLTSSCPDLPSHHLKPKTEDFFFLTHTHLQKDCALLFKMAKIIVGLMGSSVSKGSSSVATPSQVSSFLSVCKKHKVHELDTARVYNEGKSEELLGSVPERHEFAIATKAPGFSPGSLSYDNIIDNCNKSVQALKLGDVGSKIDIYYFHGPDNKTPIEDSCKAIDVLYKEGKFSRFGISNLSDEVVTKIYEYCKEQKIILPSVYQGGYNPIHRNVEKTLLPLLKKYNMSFYAWGPLAGGALAKDIDEIMNPKEGSRYQAMPYLKDHFLKDGVPQALQKINTKCKQNNTTLLEASLRWLKHHSALKEQDGIILGASTNEQLEANLKAAEGGPLDESLVNAFEELWDEIKHVAPAYSF